MNILLFYSEIRPIDSVGQLSTGFERGFSLCGSRGLVMDKAQASLVIAAKDLWGEVGAKPTIDATGVVKEIAELIPGGAQ